MLKNAAKFLKPIVPATGVILADAALRNNHRSLCDFSSYTYPANNPTEDRWLAHKDSGNNWKIAAVFDGHGGWQVSEYASQNLLRTVLDNLSGVRETDEITIDEQIALAFNKIEDNILQGIRAPFKMGFGEVAKVGSCVLLAMKKSDRLVIANCGDCRAVMGSVVDIHPHEKDEESEKKSGNEPSSNGSSSYGGNSWGGYSSKQQQQQQQQQQRKAAEDALRGRLFVSTRLNRDHNARVPLEHLNLTEEHPNEDNIVRCKSSHACYVKGRLQLTRSLGDAYLKYPEFNAAPDKHRSSGRHIPAPYTPPYVSHQPEMHHIRLAPADKFVIVGTDGLWDYLSDQEAVDIVARCFLEREQQKQQLQRRQEADKQRTATAAGGGGAGSITGGILFSAGSLFNSILGGGQQDSSSSSSGSSSASTPAAPSSSSSAAVKAAAATNNKANTANLTNKTVVGEKPISGARNGAISNTTTTKNNHIISDSKSSLREDTKQAGSVSDLADVGNLAAYHLVERALELASAESGLTLDQLKSLPPGRDRRRRHDDTTAVVMFF